MGYRVSKAWSTYENIYYINSVWKRKIAPLTIKKTRVPKIEKLQQATPSKQFKGNLLDFQREGLDFLIKSSGNALLADEMGLGKTVQTLAYLSKEKNYIFKISDIHFEIDMDLLGCNARILWNEIYKSIVDIVKTRPSHKGIILCKNFNKIHNELLDTFYSYMQTLEDNTISSVIQSCF